MLKVVASIVMVFYFICPSLAIEVKLVGSIILSQENTILGAVESFTITEDGLFILPDCKEGNFKIFDENGEFVKVWGRSGPGPLEFGSPCSCDYSNPYLACYDIGKLKVLVFKRTGKTEFEKVAGFQHRPDKLDLKIVKDEVFFAGYI